MTDVAGPSRSDRLDHTLRALLGSTPEIEAAAVVTFDGLPMASALPPSMDEDRVAAMSAALLSLGERAAQGLGRGELSQVYIEGDAGTVFLVSAEDEAVLVAVAAKGAKAGMMLYEVKRSAARVADVLRADDDAPAPVAAPVALPAPAAAPNVPAQLRPVEPLPTVQPLATVEALHAAVPLHAVEVLHAEPLQAEVLHPEPLHAVELLAVEPLPVAPLPVTPLPVTPSLHAVEGRHAAVPAEEPAAASESETADPWLTSYTGGSPWQHGDPLGGALPSSTVLPGSGTLPSAWS